MTETITLNDGNRIPAVGAKFQVQISQSVKTL